LEQEISKLAYAFISRDARIGGAIIDNLCDRFSLEEVAGITLICLQRIMWFDADAFVWTIENLIPAEVMREIRQISSVTLGKRLIDKGLMPGQDFSVDSISAGRFLAALRRKMQG
jgi:hypothetical protein